MAELSDIERILGEAEQATAAGDHRGAERSLRRALRLQEAALGLVHPDVANTLNDLGVACDRLGRPDEGRVSLSTCPRHRQEDAGTQTSVHHDETPEPLQSLRGPGAAREARQSEGWRYVWFWFARGRLRRRIRRG